MKFENFTEFVTLAFWGMKGLMYFTSGPDKLQPSACSSWLLQEAVVRKSANWKELSLEFLECLKDIIQDTSWRDSGSLNSTSAEELYERSNGSWWCPEGQSGSIVSKSQIQKIAFKYGNL